MTHSENETFDLDPQQIERNYKKLQTVFHPDKFANASQVSSHAHQYPLQALHEQSHSRLLYGCGGLMHIYISNVHVLHAVLTPTFEVH